ncbi:OprO/OprP family phosphate-selective porin [Geothrix campi]|uniref:OprO/OprP family phosphate-selective porin n=1 Tax=Geothrix campi TaxID=2966450 RepID=UPI00214755FE|nr:OprO/OprP family phosphate-selective porin [Geothrix sp. SG10]
MKITRLAGVAALLAAGVTQAQAQDIKLTGVLFEFWQTQMLDSNLRNNATAAPAGTATKYYGLDSRFQENTFAVKRAEIYLNGKITDDISWNLMFDPNNSNTTAAPNNVLQDIAVTWNLGSGFTVKAGQFKMPTTYEATMVAATNILFFERNQINRVFGDKRDRAIWGIYAFGDPKGFNGKVNLAISNGTTDDGSGGKNNENTLTGAGNAQKDWTTRLEFNYGPEHKFGAYYREGVTGLKDSTFLNATVPATWTVGAPSAAQIKDNKDKTTLLGAYYAFDTATWHASAELATGLLGRRYPTLFAAGTTTLTPLREHLDQKFMGYAIDGAYKMGQHWFTARYDMLNYNTGDDWYTATNPYMPAAGGDYSPKYTEITVGYNYVFNPAKYGAGKLKLDYVHRSKNFLAPRAGQTGEQGGDSLVASLMVGF